MKYVKADLLADIVSSYDQTKTTIQGRVASKIISGDTALGPPLNKFIDTFIDTAASSQVAPVLTYLSPNGRLFSIGAEASGIVPISLHIVNLTTGATTYIGTIRSSFPDLAATTHIMRGLKVVDTGTTGWRIFIASSGSVAINGGLFCINNVDLADFLAVGPGTLFPNATGSNQKATYFLQDPSNIGVGQLNIASAGVALDVANNRVYVHNGVSATHQFYVYSTTATLDCPLSAGLSIDAGTDRVTHTAHGYLNNDPVFLTNLSGGAGLTNNTIYFVRNVTANDYQLSTTSGGAAINITTNGTADICRAFGTTGSAWVHKTGNLPALAGTLIASDSEDYALPGHTTNSGFPCIFFCTSSNLYLGRISELTSGAVTWPSLVTSNLLGTANQIVAPTLQLATWSNVLDRAIYLTNNNILIMKQVVNNSIDKIFAGANNLYREGTPPSDVVPLQWINAGALDVEDGWIAVQTITNVGQRGVILVDLRSDELFDYSYIVTKVLDTPNSIYKFITTVDSLYDFTGSLKVQYRTSGFGSISGGWTDIAFAEDLSGVAAGNQVQFKILFDTLTLDTVIHAQLIDFFLGFESNTAISDNWEFSDDFSDNNVPSRSAFRLKKAYVSSVPQLYFRAYDLSDALLINHNTVANAANFEYSTDNGTSWLPLGTIPNVVGTMLRYSFTSPPGVDIRPGLKES
jgi:hypothetical protein